MYKKKGIWLTIAFDMHFRKKYYKKIWTLFNKSINYFNITESLEENNAHTQNHYCHFSLSLNENTPDLNSNWYWWWASSFARLLICIIFIFNRFIFIILRWSFILCWCFSFVIIIIGIFRRSYRFCIGIFNSFRCWFR